MKPQKRVELVERTYWACDSEWHRHKTEAIARNCIARGERGSLYSPRKWSDEVLNKCTEDHAAGKSYREIGKALGISGSRVSQLIQKWESVQKRMALLGKDDRRFKHAGRRTT